MSESLCPIWKTPAQEANPGGGDFIQIFSPRAGGEYRVTGTAFRMTAELQGDMKRALLTTWLCNQRRAGIAVPVISADVLSSVSSFVPLSTTGRIERTLLHFNKHIRIGQVIPITPLSLPAERPEENVLMAISECVDQEELIAFMNVLADMGWVTQHLSHMSALNFTLTASGWLKVEELITRLPDTTQAFVAMWFNEATHAAYTNGIELAIMDAGYRPVRIDKKEHNNKIDDEIIAEIRRSKFLVADFTCEKDKVRGGVYFEAGFAMGLGIDVIWTVFKDSLSDVHFDTRQYNHVVWDTPETLRRLLADRIGAVIGDGPLKNLS
jgi:nucleoside 2-deoxyribosyltransferase